MIETWQIVLAGATLSGYLLALLHDDNQESMFLLGLLGALCLETTLWKSLALGPWYEAVSRALLLACERMVRWCRNETVPNDGLLRYLGFFNAERIVLTSPEALHEVLVTQNYSFPKPASLRETAGRFLGIGLILSEGDAHKLQRRSMNPAFAPRNIKALYPLFWDKTREMIEKITADRAETVEVVEWASRTTLDLIGVAGLGKDFGAIKEEDNKLVKTYNVVFQPSARARMLHLIESLVPAWVLTALPIKLNLDMSHAARSIRETCREIISSKQKKLKEKKLDDMDIISAAIRTGTFTEDGLIDQAMTLLAAGHDTTGAAFTWGIYLLAKHPEVQDRLRHEIRQRLPPLTQANESPISSINIDSMPYLQAVCSEILRFYAPVPQTLREAAHDTTILNQFIPKGTRIVIAPWATNRCTKLWGADAQSLNPDRWLYESTHGGAERSEGVYWTGVCEGRVGVLVGGVGWKF
ncbi:cytochrome P450 [Fusarium redolens]|uniref:Cytochrome P450 n=1 Tax=Fusarium redolens TaxID=48865 RepID=A0A9P9GZY7_FUSRE|nr:cytochrome P450 [Fusarium redolens]KAH7248628.1 cytochrome P450 [Fusarium redolens]